MSSEAVGERPRSHRPPYALTSAGVPSCTQ